MLMLNMKESNRNTKMPDPINFDAPPPPRYRRPDAPIGEPPRSSFDDAPGLSSDPFDNPDIPTPTIDWDALDFGVEDEPTRNTFKASLKKKVGAVALGLLVSVGAFTGFRASHDTSSETQAAPTAQIADNGVAPTISQPTERVKSSLEQRYADTKIEIQDHPFAPIETPGHPYASSLEQKSIDKILKRQQGEFVTAAKLSSGVRVNMYRSGLDDKQEPLTVDMRAMDMLVTETINHAGNIDGSPVNAQIKELQAKAARGELDLKLDIMIVSDEKLCLAVPKDATATQEAEQTLAPKDQIMKSTTQECFGGIDDRLSLANDPTAALNQFIMVIDMGSGHPHDYFDADVKATDQVLTPDQTAAVTTSHELAHALFGATDQNGVFNMDQEHALFVNHVESRMFGFFVDLNNQKQPTSVITPEHVDDPPVVTSPHSNQTVQVATSHEAFQQAVEAAKQQNQ